MHRHITHYKYYATCKEFSIAMLAFLCGGVSGNWRTNHGEATDNFYIVMSTEFRIIG